MKRIGEEIAIVQAAVDVAREAAAADALLDKIDHAEIALLDWRVELGDIFRRVRRALPERGPKAKAWGEFVRARKVSLVTAARYMKVAEYVAAHPEAKDRGVMAIYEATGAHATGWTREVSIRADGNPAPALPKKQAARPFVPVLFPEGPEGDDHDILSPLPAAALAAQPPLTPALIEAALAEGARQVGRRAGPAADVPTWHPGDPVRANGRPGIVLGPDLADLVRVWILAKPGGKKPKKGGDDRGPQILSVPLDALLSREDGGARLDGLRYLVAQSGLGTADKKRLGPMISAIEREGA